MTPQQMRSTAIGVAALFTLCQLALAISQVVYLVQGTPEPGAHWLFLVVALLAALAGAARWYSPAHHTATKDD